MKALVTGGTGYIGSRVVDLLLKNGHHVRIYSRRRELPEQLRNRDVSLMQGDLKDKQKLLDAMEEMDLFYHLGEIRNTTPGAARQNEEIMAEIIGHQKSAGIRRLVFISSLSVAGIPVSVPATEETEASVVLKDHYTQYKRSCEGMLTRLSSGSAYAVVRPGVVYGSGSRYWGKLLALIERIGSVGIPVIGGGTAAAPLIHVSDLAQAIYLAGTQEQAAGQIFNITDGIRHSWKDLLDAAALSMGASCRIIPIPPLFVRTPAFAFDVLSGMFNITMSAASYVRYVTTDLLFDPAKAKRLLGWSPANDLSQGVDEMVRGHGKKTTFAATTGGA